MDYRKLIESHLNKLLDGIGQPSLQDRDVYFASEDDFSCDNRTIHQSKIIEQDLVENFLKTTAAERSWIHANLIHIDREKSLVTIRAGAKVGNPNPSINVSLDRNHLAKIIADSK